MTQSERRIYLIEKLLSENKQYRETEIPANSHEQKQLLRSLFNVRMPKPIDSEFVKIQNEYLTEETKQKGITDFNDLEPVKKGIYIWQGDITTLKIDAVVNAANSRMLGCFYPCHGCIDNAIHTFAGVQLRLECARIMDDQGHAEETGKAKITPAFNLPCKYVLHTVGPIITSELSEKDCNLLASCYHSCMELADKNKIKSIAFCCISTGEFHFPNEKAAEIAINTIEEYRKKTKTEIEVVFNVFKQKDYTVYRKLLKAD